MRGLVSSYVNQRVAPTLQFRHAAEEQPTVWANRFNDAMDNLAAEAAAKGEPFAANKGGTREGQDKRPPR